MLLYLHVPKTAGTTLRQILDGVYGPERVFKTYDHDTNRAAAAAFRDAPRALRERTRVVAGHFHYGLHDDLGCDARYFTFLRDPLDRVASTYFYVRSTPGNPLHRAVRDMSLRDFIASGLDPYVDNGLVRLLSGCASFVPLGQLTEQHLEAAKAALRDRFVFVGLMEQFDRSLLLLAGALRWPRVPLHRNENATPQRLAVRDLDARDVAALHAFNRLDVALYAYARDMLAARLAACAWSFEARLAWYRLRLVVARRLHRGGTLSLAPADRPGRLLARGRRLLRAADQAAADEVVERIEQLHPAAVESVVLRAEVLLARGRPDEARDLLEARYAREHKAASLNLLLARLLIDLGDRRRARDILGRFIRLKPLIASSYLLYLQCLLPA